MVILQEGIPPGQLRRLAEGANISESLDLKTGIQAGQNLVFSDSRLRIAFNRN